jgi:tRNA pseudouridine32 synthase / 23S rRNA pseudouridine746 synthase
LVSKTYLARATVDPDLEFPRVLRGRIVKRRGQLQAVCEPGPPNAETLVELVGPDGLYRLTPRTGRTHQLRVQMSALGLPIIGDPLYPNIIDIPADDFSTPLQLLAQRIEFTDPRTGVHREFVSPRELGR